MKNIIKSFSQAVLAIAAAFLIYMLFLMHCYFYLADIFLFLIVIIRMTKHMVKLASYNNFLAMGLAILMALFIGEAGLRFLGINDTNTEKVHPGIYHSPYCTWEHKLLEYYPPYRKSAQKKTEFTHFIEASSLGLNDREWSLRTDSAIRIACLGDSYTEGFGAVGDSSYPRILQTILPGTDVMRCGTQGSDPLYEYDVLKEKILPYHPDIVTLTVNMTDIDDVITKGGSERYGTKDTLYPQAGPSWEFLYQYSYIVRLIVRNGMRFNYLYMSQRQYAKAKTEAIKQLEQALDKTHILCTQNNIRCIFLFNPGINEIPDGRLGCQPILDYARSKRYETIDILSFFKKKGVNLQNRFEYFWQEDGHNNNNGYRLFAESIADYLHSTTAGLREI